MNLSLRRVLSLNLAIQRKINLKNGYRKSVIALLTRRKRYRLFGSKIFRNLLNNLTRVLSLYFQKKLDLEMADKITDEKCNKSNLKENEIIFKSPFHELAVGFKVPNIPLMQMMFWNLDKNYDLVKENIWVMDVIKETSYKFSDIKPLSAKFASALTRMGFKKGDILYYVTYDSALIYILQIGTWLCGGAVRGCFQREEKEEYKRQMDETSARFVLCDPETAPSVTWAAQQLDWPVHLLSIGEVEGATSVEEMIENDDGTAFPHDIKINPKEDFIAIPNTSGSTGFPKGAIHTHYNFVAHGMSFSVCKGTDLESMIGKSALTTMGNFGMGALGSICKSISNGFSYYTISKFDQKKFLEYILKYKPSALFLYPYVANWLARAPELDSHDFSFIESMTFGGTVFDLVTAKLLADKLPQMKLAQAYGMSETLIVTSSKLSKQSGRFSDKDKAVAGLKYKKLGEEFHVTSGVLLPLVEAKGYISEVDEEGWLDTGDVAFFDETDHLYVLDRRNFIFKYYTYQVSPAEIEAVIGEHPAVLSAGVVGMPDPLTTSAARAYVVLKLGCQATEEDIIQFVAERKVSYKQLHGGVEFVDSLPENRGGKLDRTALLHRSKSNRK